MNVLQVSVISVWIYLPSEKCDTLACLGSYSGSVFGPDGCMPCSFFSRMLVSALELARNLLGICGICKLAGGAYGGY